MKNYVDLNLVDSKLATKATSLGFFTTSSLNKQVIEAPNAVALIAKCKQRGSPLFVNPLSAIDFFNSSALIEICKEKEKTIEIPLSYLLNAKNKGKLIFQLRLFLKQCLKRKVKFVFTSRATSEFEIKSPREIIAIGQMLGLTFEQATAALKGVESE